jgi:hypothetical protein
MNDETAGEDAQSQVHARCMGVTSQVQAKRMGRECEIHGRCMCGTCMVRAKVKCRDMVRGPVIGGARCSHRAISVQRYLERLSFGDLPRRGGNTARYLHRHGRQAVRPSAGLS